MEKGLEMSDTSRLDEWGRIIADCQNSGHSVKAYCKSLGITPNTYYYHLRKMRNPVKSDPQLIPINFAKVEQNSSMVSIRYHGATIEITANDDRTLCAILSALKKA